MDEAPDYTKYTLEQLDDAFQHINKQKYPDIFSKLLQEIEKRQSLIAEENPGQQEVRTWSVSGLFRYEPPNYEGAVVGNARWSPKDMVFGILFQTCLFAAYLGFFHSMFLQYLQYRPWVGLPLAIAFMLAVEVLTMFYALRLCRGRPCWHIVPLKGLWLYLKECLVSLEYLFIVMLILIPVALLFHEGLGMLTKSTRFAWTDSAPSSLLNVVILVSTFTLGPVAEELFFRGFLYSALRSRLNVLMASSAQAIIFSLFHGENLFVSIEIFALGVALAVLYERRKNLLSPILLHAIKNAMPAVPLLILTCMNYHIPAHTWEEAQQPPVWLNRLDGVEPQSDAMSQWQYAIDQWGSKGSRRWKREASGFAAVCKWYPEQTLACANPLCQYK
jgi:membrane protease YdiL (CAAX protease family)